MIFFLASGIAKILNEFLSKNSWHQIVLNFSSFFPSLGGAKIPYKLLEKYNWLLTVPIHYGRGPDIEYFWRLLVVKTLITSNKAQTLLQRRNKLCNPPRTWRKVIISNFWKSPFNFLGSPTSTPVREYLISWGYYIKKASHSYSSVDSSTPNFFGRISAN